MKNIPNEMWDYATAEDIFSGYWKHHHDIDGKDLLKKFLFSTMDEVRLYYADQYSKSVLAIVDMADMTHFRRGVLRREASNDITYAKQRDHAAHTLHNYLLGWYIFSKTSKFKQQFKVEFEKRISAKGKELHVGEVENFFGCIWPFTSLLHDIGYLFEGSIETLSTEIQDDRVVRGASVVQDFFDHRFWIDMKIDSVSRKNRLLKLAGVIKPEFSTQSLAGIANSLREVGCLEKLRENIRQKLDKNNIDIPEIINRTGGLPIDSFDLWREQYLAYSNTSMAKRMEYVQESFQTLLWEGLPNTGIRVLDHGICSGLLSLLYATYYFQIRCGLPSSKPSNPEDYAVWKHFMEDVVPDNVDYDSHWWWSAITWGTAATAIHNIQQMRQPWPGCSNIFSPLCIEEDPLAYLGILVDILQEWDRYSVSKQSIISGDIPMQGIDVLIGDISGKVTIKYPSKAHCQKICQALDVALMRWDEVVDISSQENA